MNIQIIDLHYTYPSGDKALNGITLNFSNNDPVAIVGQNGSGKTTFAKHFNGILRPTSGSFIVDGEDINAHSTAEWSRKVGYVFQNPQDQLFLESVRKELEFGPIKIKMDPQKIEENVRYAAELCQLDDKLDEHPFDLSPTQRKFCTIASVVTMDPEVILLDEPTGGQDYSGNLLLERIIKELHDRGKLVFTISHDMDFVIRNFKRIVALCKGKVIIDADARTAFSEVDVLEETFIEPPPYTRIGQALGFEKTVIDHDEYMNSFEKKLNKEG